MTLRRVAAITLLIAVLLAAAALISGRMSYVVTSGVSMEPGYHANDLVFIAPSGSYSIGDVVAYAGGANDDTGILHRIIGGDASGFEVKGDNNPSVDPTRPRAGEILGRAVVRIPSAGAVVGSPITRLVALLALVALTGALIRKPAPKPGAAHGSRRANDRSTTLWKAFVALDVVLLAALAVAVGITTRDADPVAPTTHTSALGYEARTPTSDTYPTGRLVTGDPVFLKLVDTIDVSFRYSTSATGAAVRGTVQLDAELSTSSGWHTTVPLVTRSPLVDGQAHLTAPLDLSRIQELANRVATATGVGAGPISIAVTGSASVATGDAEPVSGTAALELQLTPLALVYDGAEPSPSALGPALLTSGPLEVVTPADPSDLPTRLRLPLLVALLLCCAGTAVVWPSRGGDEPAPLRPYAVDGLADQLDRLRLQLELERERAA